MEVILKSNVKGLGNALDLVKVKPGYAQNYLFPKNLASVATLKNRALLEKDRQKAEEFYLREKNVAEELAEKMKDVSVTLAAKTTEGEKLYGSVSAKEVSARLLEKGFEIDRKQIVFSQPIKNLGMYSLKIQLHADIEVKIKLWVIGDESGSAKS